MNENYKLMEQKLMKMMDNKHLIQKDLKNAKILIVDDLGSNIDILTILLKADGYTNIEATTDPRTVIEYFNSFNPDLILLDLMMPHLSGFQVMELLQAEQLKSLNPKYLPILALTSDITTETKQKALTGGAKDFLTKPFDHIEIRYRIKNLLETQYLYQKLNNQKQLLEEKIIEFLKVNDEWYR